MAYQPGNTCPGLNFLFEINMHTSDTITELVKALVKVQEEIRNPANSANNPFFKSKYAPLDEILNLVRPLMAKNGLALIQSAGGEGTHASVTTLIMHTSGEWIESDKLIIVPAKLDAQGIGGAITYARRYTITAMLGIAGEEDDDGNLAAHGNINKPLAKPVEKPKPTTCPTCGNEGSYIRDTEFEGQPVQVYKCQTCRKMFKVKA